MSVGLAEVSVVLRVEAFPQPILDLMILQHDQVSVEDWARVEETALAIAHAARVLQLDAAANTAGVVRH